MRKRRVGDVNVGGDWVWFQRQLDSCCGSWGIREILGFKLCLQMKEGFRTPPSHSPTYFCLLATHSLHQRCQITAKKEENRPEPRCEFTEEWRVEAWNRKATLCRDSGSSLGSLRKFLTKTSERNCIKFQQHFHEIFKMRYVETVS